jgi:hypothetical protein
MQFNLFDWIREGVKQSVILGVNDALEVIGDPAGGDARDHLAHLLPASRAADGTLGTSKRKRLGRTLHDVDVEK